MAEYGLQHRDYHEAHVIRNFFPVLEYQK
jgi:hypothetical protein